MDLSGNLSILQNESLISFLYNCVYCICTMIWNWYDMLHFLAIFCPIFTHFYNLDQSLTQIHSYYHIDVKMWWVLLDLSIALFGFFWPSPRASPIRARTSGSGCTWIVAKSQIVIDHLADRHFTSLYISGQTEYESLTSIMINHDRSCEFLELWLEQLEVCMWTQCGDKGLKCNEWKVQTSWNHTWCKLHNWSCDQPAKKLMNVKSWPWREQLI